MSDGRYWLTPEGIWTNTEETTYYPTPEWEKEVEAYIQDLARRVELDEPEFFAYLPRCWHDEVGPLCRHCHQRGVIKWKIPDTDLRCVVSTEHTTTVFDGQVWLCVACDAEMEAA